MLITPMNIGNDLKINPFMFTNYYLKVSHPYYIRVFYAVFHIEVHYSGATRVVFNLVTHA